MKRFAMTEYGPANQVMEEITAAPRPVDATHVRVSLVAFAVNPYDVALRQGNMKEFRTLKFPYVLGNDGAGIVTETGSDVSHVAVGDAVIVHAVGGTYGEEIVVPGKKVVKKPETVNFETAAGIVTPFLTAYNLLTHVLGDSIGETVMVQGASGAVGSLLVQLLKEQKKTVYASASQKNEAFVRQLGVDKFAAYDTEDPSASLKDTADTVIDATKGGRASQTGMQIMKAQGRFVSLNELPEKEEKPGTYIQYSPKKEYSDFEALSAYTEKADRFTLSIAEVFPFELSSVVKAHEMMEGHPSMGKLIIKKEK